MRVVWANLSLARLALWVQDPHSGRQDFWLRHYPAREPLRGHFSSLLCTLSTQRKGLSVLQGKDSPSLTSDTTSSVSSRPLGITAQK